MAEFTKLELETMEHFKKAVLDYCEKKKNWNAELIFSFEIQKSPISNSSFNNCECTADEVHYCLTEIRPDTMYALYRDTQLFAQKPTISECFDLLIEKLRPEMKDLPKEPEVEHTESTIHSNKEESFDPVEDAREYFLQLFKDKPKFIKLGSHSINLKEIKEYSICTTREFRTLPDGTRGVDEGWGLEIWLYNENCYHTIGCETKEEAKKLQEKLDSVLGIIDLEKEKK